MKSVLAGWLRFHSGKPGSCNHNIIDRSKTRIFWIILERLVSQQFFDRPKDYFSELLYTQINFPCERHFLAPGSEKGVKRGGGGGGVKICHLP